jgi:hypothetical protein
MSHPFLASTGETTDATITAQSPALFFSIYTPPSYVLQLLRAVSLAVGVSIVAGNALIIAGLCVTKSNVDRSTSMVLSLALADMLYGTFQFAEDCVAIPCPNYVSCRHGAVFYATNSFFRDATVFSAMLHLLAIGIDRCVSILVPLRYETIMTPLVTRSLLASCWVVGIIVIIPQYVLSSTDPVYMIYFSSTRLVLYTLVSICIIAIYGKMGCIAWSQRRRIAAQGTEESQPQVSKMTRVLGTVIGCFVMLYMPVVGAMVWLLLVDYSVPLTIR